MMISTSHMKTTMSLRGLVRHPYMTKCGFSVVIIKNDRLISNDFITVQKSSIFQRRESKLLDEQSPRL